MALRQSKKKRPRREDKIDKIEWPLEEGVFDRMSLLTLEKFMKKGIFQVLDYCIAEGKEANVYRGTNATGGSVAIKMYRLRSPSFMHMQQYIEGDRRFERAKKNKFGLVFTWTQKEFSNLKLMHEMGIRCPNPIAFKHNVLAMEFLGINGTPYSRLSEVGSENPNEDYKLILSDIEKMYKNGLVHADISEFNILMTDNGPYIIDCGQAVLTSHPSAEEFYARDLENLRKYFSRYPEFKQ
ncbi:MAG: serine protein kinase RIO [Candidatus Micrarchaeia archaeon]